MKTDGVMDRVQLIAIIHVVRHSRYTIYYVPALFTVFDRPPVIYELTWREKDLTSAMYVRVLVVLYETRTIRLNMFLFKYCILHTRAH